MRRRLFDTPEESSLDEEKEKEARPETIFQAEAQDWIKENWHFRSFQGSWTPRKSPFKIQSKVIMKKREDSYNQKRRIWLIKHQKTMRIVHPQLSKPTRILTETEVAKMKATVFKWCSSRVIRMYLDSRAIHRNWLAQAKNPDTKFKKDI